MVSIRFDPLSSSPLLSFPSCDDYNTIIFSKLQIRILSFPLFTFLSFYSSQIIPRSSPPPLPSLSSSLSRAPSLSLTLYPRTHSPSSTSNSHLLRSDPLSSSPLLSFPSCDDYNTIIFSTLQIRILSFPLFSFLSFYSSQIIPRSLSPPLSSLLFS